jgi:hypothetical protein
VFVSMQFNGVALGGCTIVSRLTSFCVHYYSIDLFDDVSAVVFASFFRRSFKKCSSGDFYSVTHAFRQTTGNKADGGQFKKCAYAVGAHVQ